MLLFRSEEDVEHWCKRTKEPRGEIVPIYTVWELAKVWYAKRMDADYRGRTAAEVEKIFHDIGLRSSFWKLG
ncbi:MAG: hypothetical protein GWP61_17735 [Chloroflexi bacterium]|jgi:hypothetical protein|nr:hypothetical protein [Chloroflexota bacterium]